MILGKGRSQELQRWSCHFATLGAWSPVHEKTLDLGLLNGDLVHAVEITHCPPLLHTVGLLQGTRTTLLGLTAYQGKQRVGETDCLGPIASPFPEAHIHLPHQQVKRKESRQKNSAQRLKALYPWSQEHQRQSQDVSLQRIFAFISLFQITQGMYYYPHFIDKKN